MVKIVFSKIAKADLKEIIEYIKRDSIKYAYLEKQKIEQALDKLLLQPLLGRIMPDLNNDSLRELMVRNYRIIYQVISDKKIHILTIHHHARLISNNPAFKDDE